MKGGIARYLKAVSEGAKRDRVEERERARFRPDKLQGAKADGNKRKVYGRLRHAGIELYRPRGLKPRSRPKGTSRGAELPLLPFGNPIGFVPAASRGV